MFKIIETLFDNWLIISSIILQRAKCLEKLFIQNILLRRISSGDSWPYKLRGYDLTNRSFSFVWVEKRRVTGAIE